MIEFESTAEEPTPMNQVCVIYDRRTGRILHYHGFIGDGTGVFGPDGERERERIALECAHRGGEAEHLAVLHAPVDFDFEPEAIYRVALRSRTLEVAYRGRLVSEPSRRY